MMPVSDETLHAFVDGELDASESERLIARMRDDAALSQRVCELRSLQSMLRVAYAVPPKPASAQVGVRSHRGRLQRLVAACFVLAAGLAGGWMLKGLQDDGTHLAAAQQGLPDGFTLARLTAQADSSRVLLHIDSADPARMRAVLDQAEELLDDAARKGRTLQLEVIANGRGLDLLRKDVSPYATRIEQMHARHGNLQFVACGQTVHRFRTEGEKVVLLPAVRTAPTAISEIVTRLQQGWTYIRV